MKARHTIWTPMLLIAALTGVGVLFTVILWEAWRRGWIAIIVFLAAIMLRAAMPLPPAKRLFRKHILDPVPKSVAELKVDRARETFGYGYVFYFKISEEDLDLLIASRPFERIHTVTYGGGALYGVGWPTPLLLVYPPGKEPDWFTRRKICGREGYAYDEVKSGKLYTWVLVCDRKLGEAYFFAFKGDA